MLLNEKSKYSDKKIIEKGYNVLTKELGYSRFIRRIRLISLILQLESNGSEDYLSIQ